MGEHLPCTQGVAGSIPANSTKFYERSEIDMTVRRAIRLRGLGVDLELSKITAVKTKQRMIHFDELPDGTWRLIYNSDHISDFRKIEAFEIVRED